MKETRIIGGFSLVEMMLLLLIVSLMIASSVAVISKRHVKVPRIAMHGAYMCYYKNGNLHEERYVGANLTKKILDRDVTECSFTPPDRVSYLHIQATAGGGGGGDAGYTGGTYVEHKSATEVISPFGLTEEYVVDVKGITSAGNEDIWGRIYAYIDATGEKGDAGNGGDVWSIKRECSGTACLAERTWENKGKTTAYKEKGCRNKTLSVNETSDGRVYQYEPRTYKYYCKKDCGAEHNNSSKRKDKYDCNADCVAYEYTEQYASASDEDFDKCSEGWIEKRCPSTMKTGSCNASSCNEDSDNDGDCTGEYYMEYRLTDAVNTYACRYCDRDCTGRSYTARGCSGCTRQKDADGNNTDICASGKSTYCFSGKYEKYNGYCDGNSGYYYADEDGNWVTYLNRVCDGYADMVDSSNCGTGSTFWDECDSSDEPPTSKLTGLTDNPPATCTNYYNIPQSVTECELEDKKEFDIWVDDVYQRDVDPDTNDYPSYMEVVNAFNNQYKTDRGTKPLVEREIIVVDDSQNYQICNYGNPTLFETVTNEGIFGSFVIGLDTIVSDKVDCNSEALTEAFGEGIIKVKDGQTTTVPTLKKVNSSEQYNPIIEYDISEKTDTYSTEPYGTAKQTPALSDTATQHTDSGYISYKNPFTDVTYKPKKQFYTSCNIGDYKNWENYVKEEDTSECDKIDDYIGKGNVNDMKLFKEWNSFSKYTHEKISIRVESECMDVLSTWETFNPSTGATELDEDGNPKSGYGAQNKICMLNFDDYDDPKNETDSTLTDENGGTFTKDKCAYLATMAKGGTGGKGQSCTIGGVVGGLNVLYRGQGGIMPGIRGSNAIAIQPNELVKTLFTEAEWKSQSSAFAQNGTDSIGYAQIWLGQGEGDVESMPSCAVHKTQVPTKGTGAVKKTPGDADDSVEEGENGTDGSLEYIGASEAGVDKGDNQIGYLVKFPGATAKENYKYRYYYTWDTNYMQYGEGGKAGEYRAMIVRPAKGKEIKITLGRGGCGGSNISADGVSCVEGNTAGSGSSGLDGGDTIVGDILTVEGGKGGLGGQVTNTEQLPYWHEGGDFYKAEPGTDGETREIKGIKANIMNLVLPIDNSILGQWLTASGRGGNGGGSENKCWASQWVRYFEDQPDDASIYPEDVACRTGDYYTSEPLATDGTDGLVLIRW